MERHLSLHPLQKNATLFCNCQIKTNFPQAFTNQRSSATIFLASTDMVFSNINTSPMYHTDCKT